MSLAVERLTSERTIVRNIGLSAVGWIVPLVLAAVAIPVLVRVLGVDRFGVLGLSWTLVGYFSLFDLGLGRALTHLVADRIGRGRADELPELTWTALWLLLPLGFAGACCLAVAAPWLVRDLLRVPAPLREETVVAFRLLAVAIPFTIGTAGLRGVLEAVQAFGQIAALRIPLALATFTGPLLILPVSPTLPAVLGMLAAGRAVLWVLHLLAVRRAVPALGRVRRPAGAPLRALLSVGGWMTVSNVVSPVLSSLDRFVIGAVVSTAAVAHYTTAYEAVTRLWVITAVILPVLFPALAVAAAREPRRAALLFDRGARATLAAAVPAALLLSAFAREWLDAWVGADVAPYAAPLAQGLAAAVLVNVGGQIAYTLVQAAGRADLTGRLHLLELLPYAALLWTLLHAVGPIGAVIAWGVRVLADTGALLAAAYALFPDARGAVRRVAGLTAVAAPVVLAPIWIPGVAGRALLTAAALIGFGVYGWRSLLGAGGRTALLTRVRRLKSTAPITDAG